MNLKKPIQLTIPNLTNNVWGGSWIPNIKGLDMSEPVGESWEFSSHQSHPNKVQIESKKTIDLIQLFEKYPADLLGNKVVDKWGPQSPLIIKFIDAQENLSVQVHPGDEYAKKHENDSGKVESWIGLSEGPIYIGFDPKVAKKYKSSTDLKNSFGEAIKSGEEKNILPFLNKVTIKKGDIYHVPHGTIHAIGKGVQVFEIQQSSGVTYRLWDWNRGSRPLHVKKAIDVLDFKPPKSGQYKLKETAFIVQPQAGYRAEIMNLSEGEKIDIYSDGIFHVLTVLTGEVIVLGESVKEGFSIFLPACVGDYSIVSSKNKSCVVRSRPAF